MSEWISVERKPQHRGDVLVLTGKGVGVAWWSPDSGWNALYMPSADPHPTLEQELAASAITGWMEMPLPAPPSEQPKEPSDET